MRPTDEEADLGGRMLAKKIFLKEPSPSLRTMASALTISTTLPPNCLSLVLTVAADGT